MRRSRGRAGRRADSCSRAPTGSPAPAGSRAARGTAACAAREEAARGLSDREDVWAAGTFAAELDAGRRRSRSRRRRAPFDGELPPAGAIVGARASARAQTSSRAPARPTRSTQQLALAADQFVISTPTGPTAVAGYPWFGEWSRDAMTSYEGLFLTTGRFDEGAAVLRRAAATVSEGMLANTADTGTLEYNTADGTLWFVHALGRHVARHR